jgi:hypothetical protein
MGVLLLTSLSPMGERESGVCRLVTRKTQVTPR